MNLDDQLTADAAKAAVEQILVAQGNSRAADIALMLAVKRHAFAAPGCAERQAVLDAIEARIPGFLSGALGEFVVCATYAAQFTPAEFAAAILDCEVIAFPGGILATRAPYEPGRSTQVVADRAAAEAAKAALEAADEAAGKTLLPA